MDRIRADISSLAKAAARSSNGRMKLVIRRHVCKIAMQVGLYSNVTYQFNIF